MDCITTEIPLILAPKHGSSIDCKMSPSTLKSLYISARGYTVDIDPDSSRDAMHFSLDNSEHSIPIPPHMSVPHWLCGKSGPPQTSPLRGNPMRQKALAP